MNDMMASYFDTKKNNKNLNFVRTNNQFVNNNGYYNNVPNYQQNNNQQPQPKKKFLHKLNKVKRSVSESNKKYIATNQKWRCAHCNNLLDNTYEVDHIIALYRGGTNDLTNLEALCRNCHGVKTFKEKMGI